MDKQAYLKKFGLSVTDSRMAILDILMNAEGAIAHADIEKKTQGSFDRVTVYRTMQTFVDKGIVHLVLTTANIVLYALCQDSCSEGHHHDHHVHFNCSSCGITICLDNTLVPPVKLPNGYVQEDVKMIVTGICRDCR